MRETRTYGSEGGGAQRNGLSLPLSNFMSFTKPRTITRMNEKLNPYMGDHSFSHIKKGKSCFVGTTVHRVQFHFLSWD